MSRTRRAYIPGVRDPNGWENGYVEPQATYQNVGSQTPIAHDRDGHPVEVVGGGIMKIPGYEWHDKSPEFHKLAKKVARIFGAKIAKAIYPEDVKPNRIYMVGGSASKFLGWGLRSGPRMTWEDTTYGDEWQAYMFEGRMVFGSSAQPLWISGEAMAPSRQASKKVAGKVYPEDVKPRRFYMVGGSVSKFLGWGLRATGPTMTWEEVSTGDEWVAYMFKGQMVFGSSAQPLQISGEATAAAAGF